MTLTNFYLEKVFSQKFLNTKINKKKKKRFKNNRPKANKPSQIKIEPKQASLNFEMNLNILKLSFLIKKLNIFF